MRNDANIEKEDPFHSAKIFTRDFSSQKQNSLCFELSDQKRNIDVI